MKRIHRSNTDRMALGVSAGMAEYFGIDPALVRLAWAGLGLLYGYGIVLYLLAAFLIPVEQTDLAADSKAAANAA